MNPRLLNAIQQVERKYGTVSNPNADLSNIHHIVKKLGLFGNCEYVHKNRLWYINNEYVTINPKLMKAYHLLLNHMPISHIKHIIHTDVGAIRNIKRIIRRHKKLVLADKRLSIRKLKGSHYYD